MVKSLFWFRDDLRLSNNAGLYYALQAEKCYLVYIYDQARQKKLGSAQKVLLEQNLLLLQKDIESKGGKLNICTGDPVELIPDIVTKNTITQVYWNRRYYAEGVEKDKTIKSILTNKQIIVHSFKSTMLEKEPWQILNKQGSPYKVFTPYYNAVRSLVGSQKYSTPEDLNNSQFSVSKLAIQDLNLTPKQLNWPSDMLSHWQPGEVGALSQLETFVEENLYGYPKNRDMMAENGTSKLSLYLPLGQISTQTIANHLLSLEPSQAIEVYMRQLIWREFSYYLLWHFPELANQNFNKKFNPFNWLNNEDHLKKWQQGETGYPLIDAGMRELWQTGYMHNRVRMVVGSFLTKHLLIDWRLGEKWFWDTLIDADIAVNPASWQWVSGCGVDAAPYFRIFNPWLQSKKFDPQAEYIKHWVPELQKITAQNIHDPKKMQGYIEPIIDHDFARQRALDEYQKIK